MAAYNRTPGKTTISPEVISEIARMAALSVPGVGSLTPVPGAVNRLFQRAAHGGIQISVREETVSADIYLTVKQDMNIREVSRNVQQQVARAIQEMTGMDVGQIDIHIEDIEYEAAEA